MEDEIMNCEKHIVLLSRCTFKDCNFDVFCSFCSLQNKEKLQHQLDHFDFIKQISKDITSDLKQIEEYQTINTSITEAISQSDNFHDKLFTNLLSARTNLTESLKHVLIERYNEIIIEFENLITELKGKTENIDISDKKSLNELLSMKTKFEDKMHLISDPERIKEEFQKVTEKLERRILNYRMKDLFDGKINFSLKFLKGKTNWVGHDSNTIQTTTHTGSYWCVKSEEVLENIFEVKLKVVNISPSNVTSMWTYGFGIIRSSSNKSNDYYNDSICLFSSGSCNNKFSGGTGANHFGSWKNDDIILMKRDEQNDIYFGINSESSYKKVYDNIQGSFNVVMGFAVRCNGDIFELLEINVK